jgi:hypothetical protein
MNELFSITLDDYIEVIRRAREAGIKDGESIEPIFFAYAKEKGITSFARTELNKAELLTDLAEKHGTIMDISTDEKGVQSLNIVKKEENSPKESDFDF